MMIRFQELMGKPVTFLEDCVGEKVGSSVEAEHGWLT